MYPESVFSKRLDTVEIDCKNVLLKKIVAQDDECLYWRGTSALRINWNNLFSCHASQWRSVFNTGIHGFILTSHAEYSICVRNCGYVSAFLSIRVISTRRHWRERDPKVSFWKDSHLPIVFYCFLCRDGVAWSERTRLHSQVNAQYNIAGHHSHMVRHTLVCQ